jgi:hypothetical protein
MTDNDQFNSDMQQKDYENMSRDELVEIIGTDVDPAASRDDLIMMAMETENGGDR